ncbi:MAG: AraC family transcriptional regulator [Peptococcaceae bacterium]|nr:AraC family transcriptional regulator [Peptococcaceae bacterium]
MRNLTEQAAYLKGMAEGLDLTKDSKEGRVLNGMLDLMHELAHSVTNLDSAQNELEDYVESLDEDLNDLEDEIYEESSTLTAKDNVGFTDQYVDVECPSCHETVAFDADILEDDDVIEITCPNCDTVVFVNDDVLENSISPTTDI